MATAKMQNAPHSWQEAVDILNGRQSRKLCNNTYLQEREGGRIAVLFHQTDVVTFNTNGAIVLNSGGWRTMTTRARIHACLPCGFRLWSEKGNWFLHTYKEGHLFKDGITIRKSGMVILAGNTKEFLKSQKTRDAVKKYAKGFSSALLAGKVPMPSGGDCWYCSMFEKEGSKVSTQHLHDHMKEKYYVPSLLVNALNSMGASMMTKSCSQQLMQGGMCSEWETSILARHVENYVRKYVLQKLGMSY